ncbi:uncharacterized protein MYCFIDRAFT_63221 [Pseudocercospora fijiensis CIRAD86]|uniref:Sugar phosphate transporter domain-containing protein n=1 Tax=Pseudocercospora fijiensis (strain CIRAD86) TaxID=383855 RepID=M3BC46_PSEFD|nr:uncharacterized protein MYCFIDRAFT_63221 [Pseudocercospora fijiensis CIRAD86]EME86852.1 hypothetical protein MYCFIDRAFT_63221 [Pseudocercospora fijiensis CIRAD86]
MLNLFLTLSNKAVMQKAKLPWLLTALHTGTTAIGCASLLAMGHFELTRLATRENVILVAFSSLFTLNIAISNVSLALVSVPFHQVLRSTTPIATLLIYRIFYARTFSQQTYLTMIPLIVGVALATYGDYYFTVYGFSMTLLGVVLAALKAIASNRLMTGTLKLSPLELLFRMAPLAAVQCLFYAWGSGELARAREIISTDNIFTPYFSIILATNAVGAFALNIVSFQTNKVAGALTICVCANLKQILTIVLGIVLFSVQMTLLNGVGMAITVVGGIWYSKVELDNKRAKAASGGS